MFSEDYILRIIRQATSVLAKIFRLKNAGQYQEAIQVIDHTLEQLLGMDVEIINLLDDESLYTLLTQNDVLDLERLEFVADLFQEEGDILRLKRLIPASDNCYVRSLNYYLVISLNAEPAHAAKLPQKISSLLQKLASFDFDEQTLLNLYSYFENTKEYAKAVSMLDKLAAKVPSAAYITDEKIAFYKRLLEKSPQELTDGGTSRALIQDKLKEVESSRK
jgi:tetratricopeptide (TPR) repeat protein